VRAVRTAWGALLLLAPDPVLRRVAGQRTPDPRARAVLRVLGARHLAQAAALPVLPAGLGAAVDALHAATAAALALLAPRWRRGALLDTAVATGFAAAGLAHRGAHR
jgi:hypothetical protein